ncbi:MAG TPA: twin-arginine translocase TatA/TatE family subunit [Terriglobia bacterium]|nr:twin-arginine translocase TatA/TatE family subunit [Terriglobia bacterium]
MFGLGVPELLIIAVVVFFLFGAKRIPQMGKAVGETIKGFKKSMEGEPGSPKDQK